MTDLGLKDTQITWRQQVRTQRADGGYNQGSPTDSTIWAHVRPASARESEIANRMTGQVTYLITIEQDELPAGYNSDDTVVWEGLALNIREIRLPRPRELHVEIVAESGVTE